MAKADRTHAMGMAQLRLGSSGVARTALYSLPRQASSLARSDC